MDNYWGNGAAPIHFARNNLGTETFLGLNYENLCDNDYLTRLLSSSDGGNNGSDAQTEGNQGSQSSKSGSLDACVRILSSTRKSALSEEKSSTIDSYDSTKYMETETKGEKNGESENPQQNFAMDNWMLGGDMPEDLVIFGDKHNLGRDLMKRRFLTEVNPSLFRHQDNVSMLVFRQIVIFEEIGQGVLDECFKITNKSDDKDRNKNGLFVVKDIDNSQKDAHLVNDALKCAIRVLELESRHAVKQSTVEPVIQLLLKILRTSFRAMETTNNGKNDKSKSKQRSFQDDVLSLGLDLQHLGSDHLCYVRTLLCNPLLDLHKYSPVHNFVETDQGPLRITARDRENKLRLCLSVSYGLLCVGMYTHNTGDIMIALSNLMSIAVVAEEWRSEVLLLDASETFALKEQSLPLLQRNGSNNNSSAANSMKGIIEPDSAKQGLIEKIASKQKHTAAQEPVVKSSSTRFNSNGSSSYVNEKVSHLSIDPYASGVDPGSGIEHAARGSPSTNLDGKSPAFDFAPLLAGPLSTMGDNEYKKDCIKDNKASQRYLTMNRDHGFASYDKEKDYYSALNVHHVRDGGRDYALNATATKMVLDKNAKLKIQRVLSREQYPITQPSSSYSTHSAVHHGIADTSTSAPKSDLDKVVPLKGRESDRVRDKKTFDADPHTVPSSSSTASGTSNKQDIHGINDDEALKRLHETVPQIYKDTDARSFIKVLKTYIRVPKSILQLVRDCSMSLKGVSTMPPLSLSRTLLKQQFNINSMKKSHDNTASATDAGSTAKDNISYIGKSTGNSSTYVWSSGQNSYGELGHGDVTQRRSFARVTHLDDKYIENLGAGNEHSVFVDRDGKLFVCGYNENGQCGLGTTQQARHVTPLPETFSLFDQKVSKAHVFNGCEHTLVTTIDGDLFAFGYNYRGQLGVGSTNSELSPKLVQGPLLRKQVISCASSYHHSLMLCSDGSLFSVGRNDSGQLGHGDTVDRKTPEQMKGTPSDITSLSCGQFHSVIATKQGYAYVCGKNDYGQLGLDSNEPCKMLSPVPRIPDNQLVQQVVCGYYHTLLLLQNGVVLAFGRNDYGQLGLGHSQPRVNGYHVVNGLRDKNVTLLSAGCYHSIAVTANGMLYVFGRNNHGQLGTGDLQERHSPHPIDFLLGKRVLQVAAGFYHTLVLAQDELVGSVRDPVDEYYQSEIEGIRMRCTSDGTLTDEQDHIDNTKDTKDSDNNKDIHTNTLDFDSFIIATMMSRLQRKQASDYSPTNVNMTEYVTMQRTALLNEMSAMIEVDKQVRIFSTENRSKVTLRDFLPYLIDHLGAVISLSVNEDSNEGTGNDTCNDTNKLDSHIRSNKTNRSNMKTLRITNGKLSFLIEMQNLLSSSSISSAANSQLTQVWHSELREVSWLCRQMATMTTLLYAARTYLGAYQVRKENHKNNSDNKTSEKSNAGKEVLSEKDCYKLIRVIVCAVEQLLCVHRICLMSLYTADKDFMDGTQKVEILDTNTNANSNGNAAMNETASLGVESLSQAEASFALSRTNSMDWLMAPGLNAEDMLLRSHRHATAYFRGVSNDLVDHGVVSHPSSSSDTFTSMSNDGTASKEEKDNEKKDILPISEDTRTELRSLVATTANGVRTSLNGLHKELLRIYLLLPLFGHSMTTNINANDTTEKDVLHSKVSEGEDDRLSESNALAQNNDNVEKPSVDVHSSPSTAPDHVPLSNNDTSPSKEYVANETSDCPQTTATNGTSVGDSTNGDCEVEEIQRLLSSRVLNTLTEHFQVLLPSSKAEAESVGDVCNIVIEMSSSEDIAYPVGQVSDMNDQNDDEDNSMHREREMSLGEVPGRNNDSASVEPADADSVNGWVSLNGSVDASLASIEDGTGPGTEGRTGLRGLQLRTRRSAFEASEHVECFRKHLLLLCRMSRHYVDLHNCIRLFQESNEDGLVVFHQLLTVYNHLCTLSLTYQKAGFDSNDDSDNTSKASSKRLFYQFVRTSRTLQFCLSNFIKVATPIIFTYTKPFDPAIHSSMNDHASVDHSVSMGASLSSEGKKADLYFLGLSVLRNIFSASEAILDVCGISLTTTIGNESSDNKVEVKCREELLSSLRHITLLPSLLPSVLALAVSFGGTDTCLHELLGELKSIISKIQLVLQRSDNSNSKTSTYSTASVGSHSKSRSSEHNRESASSTAWLSRVLKLAMVLYTKLNTVSMGQYLQEESLLSTPVDTKDDAAAIEEGAIVPFQVCSKFCKALVKHGIWRYLGYPEHLTAASSTTVPVIPDVVVSLCGELRYREMITDHTYRVLYMQSSKKKEVNKLICSIECMLFQAIAHVNGSDSIDYWPLNISDGSVQSVTRGGSRQSGRNGRVSLQGDLSPRPGPANGGARPSSSNGRKQGHKLLARLWSKVSSFTKMIHARRSAICDIVPSGVSWLEILTTIEAMIAKQCSFLLQTQQTVSFKLQPLPCIALYTATLLPGPSLADVSGNPVSSSAGNNSSIVCTPLQRFRKCVNVVICSIRWKNLLKKRVSCIDGLVTDYMTSYFEMLLPCCREDSYTKIKCNMSNRANVLSKVLGYGTQRTRSIAMGIQEICTLLQSTSFSAYKVDIFMTLSITLRGMGLDLVDGIMNINDDSNNNVSTIHDNNEATSTVDVINGANTALVCTCSSIESRLLKTKALGRLEGILVDTLLEFYDKYKHVTTDAGPHEMTKLTIVVNLLHLLIGADMANHNSSNGSNNSGHILPSRISPTIIGDLLSAIMGEGEIRTTTGSGDEKGPGNASNLRAKQNNRERSRILRHTSNALFQLLQSLSVRTQTSSVCTVQSPSLNDMSTFYKALDDDRSAFDQTNSSLLCNQLLQVNINLLMQIQGSRLMAIRVDSDPLGNMSKANSTDSFSKDKDKSSSTVNANKRRCQELINRPIEFNRSQQGFVVQGDKLLSNYKGMDFTLAMWMMPTAKPTQPRHAFITGKISHNDAWPLISLRNDGKLVVLFGHGSEFERMTSQAVVPLWQWTHVTVVTEPKKIKLFVNGIMDSQVTTKGNGRAILYPVVVGSCPNGLRTRIEHVKEGFDGILSQYKYYTRALSPIHVRVVYDQGPPENYDYKERWLFHITASVRLLLDSCGRVLDKNVLTKLAKVVFLIFVSDDTGRLRSSCLIIIKDILSLNIIDDLTLTSNSVVADLTSSNSNLKNMSSTTALDTPLVNNGNGHSVDSKVKTMNIMASSLFPQDCHTFESRVVLFFLRLIGLAWSPLVHNANADTASMLDHVLIEKSSKPSSFECHDNQDKSINDEDKEKGDGDTEDGTKEKDSTQDTSFNSDTAEGTNLLREFLEYLPSFINDTQSCNSHPLSSPLSIGDNVEKMTPREGLINEFCILICSLLHSLSAHTKWRAGFQVAMKIISDRFVYNNTCIHDGKVDLNHWGALGYNALCTIDVLGASLFVGNKICGAYSGTSVECYHTNTIGRVLHVNRNNRLASIIAWNANTNMYQLSAIRRNELLLSRNMRLHPLLHTTIVTDILKILSSLQRYVYPLASDLLSIYRIESPFIKNIAVKAIRPTEVFIFGNLIYGLSKSLNALPSSHVDNDDENENMGEGGATNPNIATLFSSEVFSQFSSLFQCFKELALHVQYEPMVFKSAPVDAELMTMEDGNIGKSRVNATALWVKVCKRLSVVPHNVSLCELPSQESERFIDEYISQALGVTLETCQNLQSVNLLKQGKLFDLIQYIAVACGGGSVSKDTEIFYGQDHPFKTDLIFDDNDYMTDLPNVERGRLNFTDGTPADGHTDRYTSNRGIHQDDDLDEIEAEIRAMESVPSYHQSTGRATDNTISSNSNDGEGKENEETKETEVLDVTSPKTDTHCESGGDTNISTFPPLGRHNNPTETNDDPHEAKIASTEHLIDTDISTPSVDVNWITLSHEEHVSHISAFALMEINETDLSSTLSLLYLLRKGIVESSRNIVTAFMKVELKASTISTSDKEKDDHKEVNEDSTTTTALISPKKDISDSDGNRKWNMSVWEYLVLYPSSDISKMQYSQHIAHIIKDIDFAHRLEFTQALASSLRFTSISLLNVTAASKNNNYNILDGTDFFGNLSNSIGTWMDAHSGHEFETDVCATFLKMLLPALSFVESKDIEMQLLTLCLRAMKRLVAHTLQGKDLYSDIMEISRGNNFILLRARAQEQMAKVADCNRHGALDIGVILDELVVDMEFIQRNGRREIQQEKSDDDDDQIDEAKNDGNISTAGHKNNLTIKLPTDVSTPLHATTSANNAPLGSTPGTSKKTLPLVHRPLYHTSPPVLMAVRSYSVDIDLRPCLKAIRQSSTPDNDDKGSDEIFCKEMEKEKKAVESSDVPCLNSKDGTIGNIHMSNCIEYNDRQDIVVEVAMGVVVEEDGDDSDLDLPCNRKNGRNKKKQKKNTKGHVSDDTVYQTVYVGSSYRFIESGLSSDCKYAVKCRIRANKRCQPISNSHDTKNRSSDTDNKGLASNTSAASDDLATALDALETVYEWSSSIYFRTEQGAPFVFDSNRRGSDILISDNGMTASYAADDSWSTVLGDRSFCSGVTSWEVRIARSSTAYIFVGVATSEADLNSFLGGCDAGWGFIGEQSLYHNREKVKVYGEAFGVGDIVGIILDLDNGYLSFSRNGKILGVAFNNIYGELFPAVAFYNMGQEITILQDGFHTTSPQEPIPISPNRYSMYDVSFISELMLSINSSTASFSPRILEYIAHSCNEWCSNNSKYYVTVSGKGLFLKQQSVILHKYGFKVGERVRVPSGVAIVAGEAYGRVWFLMSNDNESNTEEGSTPPVQRQPRVWYYSNKQIRQHRRRGMFKRCTYEPKDSSGKREGSYEATLVVSSPLVLDTPRSNDRHANNDERLLGSDGQYTSAVDSLLSTPTRYTTIHRGPDFGSPEISRMTPLSGNTSTLSATVGAPPANTALYASPPGHRVIINDGIASTGKNNTHQGVTDMDRSTTAFDAAGIVSDIDNAFWSKEMDACLVHYLVSLIPTHSTINSTIGNTSGGSSPGTVWDVTVQDVLGSFRKVQQSLTKIVMVDEKLNHRWGFKGPKRRAVIARLALLRMCNFLINQYSGILVRSSSDLGASYLDNIDVTRSLSQYHSSGLGHAFKDEDLEPVIISVPRSYDSSSSYTNATTGLAALDVGRDNEASTRTGEMISERRSVYDVSATLSTTLTGGSSNSDAVLRNILNRHTRRSGIPDVQYTWLREIRDEEWLEKHSSITHSSHEDSIYDKYPETGHHMGDMGSDGGSTLMAFKGRIFTDIKTSYFYKCLDKTACRPSKTEDDYDYPDDLPQLKINRIKSYRAREAAQLLGIPGEDLIQSSMFYQLWKELRKQSAQKLRMTYTHPMDDGQSRAFKISFEAEGVDDYGGPYREVFQQICDELCCPDPSASSAAGKKRRGEMTSSGASRGLIGPLDEFATKENSQSASAIGTTLHSRYEGGEKDTKNEGIGSLVSPEGDETQGRKEAVRCLLPLLHPTPNWSAEECTERYKYVFHPASTSHLHMDLFRFMGQLIGIAIRSKISVELPLPSYLWKRIVRDRLTEADIASFDNSSYTFIKHLSNIYVRYINALHKARTSNSSLQSSLQDEVVLIEKEASFVLQDLYWSFTTSDGHIHDLVRDGKTRPVLLEEVGEYMPLFVTAKLNEGSAATEAFREGLISIIPETALNLLCWSELQSLVCGASHIDIEVLKRNVEYDEDISGSDAHILYFWSALESFSEEERAAFLRFVWARPTLPPKGVPFPQKFKIQAAVGDDANSRPDKYLPRAHTCFFSINLPKYTSYEVMREKLRYAIYNCTEMDADFRLTDTEVVGWGGAIPSGTTGGGTAPHLPND